MALAPDLPTGYYSWGVALAKRRDFAGATLKLTDANRRGPHWADLLKAWGDVLVKQGQVKEVLTKYDEALKYAPNWKQLKEAREAAVKQKSLLDCCEADIHDRQLRVKTGNRGQSVSRRPRADGRLSKLAARKRT